MAKQTLLRVRQKPSSGAQKEAQIQRLERLVFDAIYALQKAGFDDAANRLRRTLQKE